MPTGGDYTRPWSIYGSSCVDFQIPSVFQTTALIVAKGPKQAIKVQRIIFDPTTFVACVMTFQDSTGVVVATFEIPANPPAAAGIVDFTADYGGKGFKLTPGANLILTVTPTGVTGQLHIDAYQTPLVYTTH